MSNDDSHYLISHETDNKFVKVHASNKERCEMPYTIFLNNYFNGTPLIREIFYQPPSEHYRSALQQLANSLWAIG
jgi:hypothetical protein